MIDSKMFKLIGALQFLIAFINFYVANQSAGQLGTLNLAVAALCTMTGVFCTVVGAKLMGLLK